MNVQRLIELTKSGKLQWELNTNYMYTRFQCVLDGIEIHIIDPHSQDKSLYIHKQSFRNSQAGINRLYNIVYKTHRYGVQYFSDDVKEMFSATRDGSIIGVDEFIISLSKIANVSDAEMFIETVLKSYNNKLSYDFGSD